MKEKQQANPDIKRKKTRCKYSQQVNKFIYCINMVENLNNKISKNNKQNLSQSVSGQQLSPIRQYLLFLYGSLYFVHSTVEFMQKIHNPSSLQAQKPGSLQIHYLLETFPKDYILTRIQELLSSQPSNLTLWVMYIEYQFLAKNVGGVGEMGGLAWQDLLTSTAEAKKGQNQGNGLWECVECYLSCINMIVKPANVKKEEKKQQDSSQKAIILRRLQVVYWMSEFLYRYEPKLGRAIITNVLRWILLDEVEEDYIQNRYDNQTQNQINQQDFNKESQDYNQEQRVVKDQSINRNNQKSINVQYIKKISSNIQQSNLKQIQKLLIGNRIKQLLKHTSLLSNKQKNSMVTTSSPKYQQSILYYILLQIGQNSKQIIPILLRINTQISIDILMSFNLLEFAHVKQENLMSAFGWIGYQGRYVSLKMATWFSGKVFKSYGNRLQALYSGQFTQCCINLRRYISRANNKVKKVGQDSQLTQGQEEGDDYYEQPSNNTLFLWLLIMRILQPQQRFTSQTYKQFLYKFEHFSKKIEESLTCSCPQPLCTQLLHSLLKNPTYSYHCLNMYPYIRELYQIAGLNQEYLERVEELGLDKEIRGIGRSKGMPM